MRKKIVLSLIVAFWIIISMSIILAANDENNGVPSLLSGIKGILQDILLKLELIADKETNVNITIEPNITVQPPEVIVNPNLSLEGGNEMAKRGNIILKTYGLGGSSAELTTTPLYASLPNGNCSITVSTDCPSCFIGLAKEINLVKDETECYASCSLNLKVDDEYSMIRIKPNGGSNPYNEMYVAYSCV